MAAPLGSETAPAVDAVASGVDRQQWWTDVQAGVSAMLTEAVRAGVPERLAG